MAASQPSKLIERVRFPSPAPHQQCWLPQTRFWMLGQIHFGVLENRQVDRLAAVADPRLRC